MPLGRAEVERLGRAPWRHAGRWVALGCFALVVLVGALAALVLVNSREAYGQRAMEQAEGIAAGTQAQVAGQLAEVDVLLRVVVRELQQLRDEHHDTPANVEAMLAAHQALMPAIEAFRLVDADGWVRRGRGVDPTRPVDVRDRDYFRTLRDDPRAGRLVAGPIRSRLNGHWVLLVARRIDLADGAFGGIAYASVPVEHFERMFRRMEIGVYDSIVLRTAGYAMVARHAPGGSPIEVGSTVISKDLANALRGSPDRGFVVSRNAVDGVVRTTYFRRVEGFPFIVLAGLGNDRFYAPWQRQVWQVVALWAFVSMVLAAAAWGLYRAWRGEAEGARALAVATRRVRTLLRAAADGIAVLDRDGRVIEVSDSLARLLGRDRDQLLGHVVTEWDVGMAPEHVLGMLRQAHEGERLRLETRYRHHDGHLLDIELHISATRIDGLMFIYVAARDITERKQLEARVSAQAERIHDLYDQAPCGYHSLDSEGRFLLANATLLSWIGCSAEEVIGKRRLIEFFDEEGQALFSAHFPRFKREGRMEGLEFVLVSREGERRRVRASVTAIYDADGTYVMSRSVLHDVTALHEAREAMAALLRDQAAMLDNDLVAMVRLRERTVTWKNRALDRLFGYAAGDLDSGPVRRLFTDDASYAAIDTEDSRAHLQGGRFRQQLPMRHRDGTAMWIDMSGVALSDGESLWMMTDITPMKQAHQQVEHIAFHDALTGLPNRLLLADRLAHALRGADRAGGHVAVCFLDLDGFKQVNDAWGHDAGDALLREVAMRLQDSVRGNDTAARLGGDEFVLVLTHLESEAEAGAILDRLLDDLGRPFLLPDRRAVRIGASIGVAMHPDHGADAQALMMRADRAMFAAKRAGKNRVVVAQDDGAGGDDAQATGVPVATGDASRSTS